MHTESTEKRMMEEMTFTQEQDCRVLWDVPVSMRDGVKLYADVYLPGDGTGGPWPALLEMLPYDKSGVMHQQRNIPAPRFDLVARRFVGHNYATVLVDTRGRYKSEGVPYWIGMANEGPDGHDIVEWIGKQPWCNGKVGMYGTSYMAYNQYATAAESPSHLAALVPNQGPSNLHDWCLRVGGAYALRYLISAMAWLSFTYKEVRADPKVRAALERAREQIPEWLDRLPLKKDLSPLSPVPSQEEWFLKTYQEGDFTEFWRSTMLALDEYYDRFKDVPTYFISSWYDPYPYSTAREFAALRKIIHSPTKLLLGPWLHGRNHLHFAGDIGFGFDAAVDLQEEQLRWLDAVMQDKDNGILSEPPVKIFVMGGGTGRKDPFGRLDHGGHWRFEDDWPLARTQYTPYYLHGDGSLSSELTGEDPPSVYQYNPRDPVPTLGGPNGHIFPPGGGQDQRGKPENFWWCKDDLPLSSRRDVLVFRTPPLEEAVEVTGAIKVVLYASSDCPDTDFTAKLIDVYPPNEDYPEGYDLNLSNGIIRARYRNSKEKAELMDPGEIYCFEIIIPTTSNLFQAGHRIRLDVSSSNFPAFDPNPNTGEPLGRHRRVQVATNTIYHDKDHPSHALLPIIPSKEEA